MSTSPLPRRLFATSAFAAAAGAALFGTPLRGLADSLLRFSIGVPAADPVTLQLINFARLAQSLSHGAVQPEVYPSSQIAKEQEVIADMQSGVLDGALLNTSWMDNVFKRQQALGLPFLFPSPASMWRVLDGEIGRSFSSEMADRGIQVLAWGAYSIRQFEFRDRRVTKPEDMRGLRIRIIDSPLYVAMMRALGAVPVPTASAETYTALAQKTVDGLDYPLPSLLSTKISQVVKSISLTDHGMNAAALIVSKKKFEGLPSEQQRSLAEAARQFLPGWRHGTETWNATALQECQQQGLVVDKVDKPAFRRAMTPVYESYRQALGADYIDRIVKLAVT